MKNVFQELRVFQIFDLIFSFQDENKKKIHINRITHLHSSLHTEFKMKKKLFRVHSNQT